MKKIKLLVVLALVFISSVSMVAYAMPPVKANDIEAELELLVTEPEPVVMYGCLYTPYEKTENGIALYEYNDDKPATYIVDAINESGITPDMSKYIQMLNLANYVSEKLSYDNDAAAFTNINKEYWRDDFAAFTSYSVLTGKAVCAGYADLYQDLCRAIGIECWYLTGYVSQNGKETYHAWNAVSIDGITYYIDTCWYDSSSSFRWCDTETLECHGDAKWCKTYRIDNGDFSITDFETRYQ